MCGIAGYLGLEGSADEGRSLLRRMGDAIRHRGPDADGIWTDDDAGLGFVHRRLSIVDLSPAGSQPMVSADGRWVVAYNGEIYNHAALRRELEVVGEHQWRGHSDTEVLLAAIAHWGLKQALERSVGMFAITLWDRKTRTLSLARDRIGEKPLYYGWLGKEFVFASEPAALSLHPRWTGEIDRDALALLMRHNYIPAPYSIFKGIAKVEPGTILTFENWSRDVGREVYWTARDAAERGRSEPFTGSADEAVDHVDALLRQSLGGQMVADVPLGAFLSGGIDSSTVVAVMQAMSDRPVKTFTIGFDVSGYNEAVHATKVAEHLGTDHTELYVTGQDALDVVPQLPGIFSEPFADSSQVPTFLISKLARSSVTVSLSGDAGDELFSGYTRYGVADQVWSRLSRIPTGLRQSIAGLATLISPRTYDRLAKPIVPLLPRRYRHERIGDKVHKGANLLSLKSIDDIYLRLCSHWQNANALVIGSKPLATALTGRVDLPDLAGPVEGMMYKDLISYLPDDILVKVDRAAMAVSLETRVPMLDHRLVEFALSLPLSISRKSGVAKWPLRQVLYRHVPQQFVDRPKMGFGIPIDTWLRGSLRDWAEDLLSESRLRQEGYFEPAPVRQAWQEHLSGYRNNQYQLWDVLMFQAWTAQDARTKAIAA